MELTQEQKLLIGDIYERAITLAETYGRGSEIVFSFEFNEYKDLHLRVYDTKGGSFKRLAGDEMYLVRPDGTVNEECLNAIYEMAENIKYYFQNQEERIKKNIESLERSLANMKASRDALAKAHNETVEA